jgi:chromosome segregation ATPase
MQKITLLLAFTLVSLFSPYFAMGQDEQASSTETRLRQALRDTMVQLRDAQNQVVTLQATQAQSDKDKADLQAKVDALTAQVKNLTDQAATDKAASDDAIAGLKSQVTDQTGQIGRLNDGLKQWKDAYNQVAQLATAKETARAQLALQAALLQRTVDDRETKNLALYKLGNEILTRYEQFGLGDALAAKEPFVGVTRVKLENLVQDYKNKLLDQAITSGQPMAPAPDALQAQKQNKPATATPQKPANPT